LTGQLEGIVGRGIGLGIEALTSTLSTTIETCSTTVNQSVNAACDVQYLGQTVNFGARAAAHAGRFGIQRIPDLSNLSPSDARAVEQVLIETHGLATNGGALLNKINSIASSNPIYAQSLQRGAQILQQVGYFK
jgi:filamentous hemagglutinin